MSSQFFKGLAICHVLSDAVFTNDSLRDTKCCGQRRETNGTLSKAGHNDQSEVPIVILKQEYD
jgi:hypothetical protein